MNSILGSVVPLAMFIVIPGVVATEDEADAKGSVSSAFPSSSKSSLFPSSSLDPRMSVAADGKEHKTVSEQLRAMIGLTRGFDSLLLMAITGKNRGQYNGKYGEKGMDGQNKVSVSWRGFLTEKGKSLSEEDWQMAVDFLFNDLPTAGYGFPPYGEHGFDGFEETLTESQKAVWADRKT